MGLIIKFSREQHGGWNAHSRVPCAESAAPHSHWLCMGVDISMLDIIRMVLDPAMPKPWMGLIITATIVLLEGANFHL